MRTLLKEYKEISLKLLYELKKDNLNEAFKLSEERQQDFKKHQEFRSRNRKGF
jgi:hypothetical protein